MLDVGNVFRARHFWPFLAETHTGNVAHDDVFGTERTRAVVAVGKDVWN